MARYSAINRPSVGSMDEDDKFYSAPSSRVASRHVSLVAHDLSEEVNHSTLPSAPLAIGRQPRYSSPILPPETQTPVQRPTSKPKWPFYFGTRRHHSPKHHHFCPKPIARRFHRTFHGTSDSIPLLQPLTNRSDLGSGDYIESLISSHGLPASPIMTGRWSSVHTGNHSPRSMRSNSLTDSPMGDPINITRQGADAIVGNIRAYLSDRRHNDCPSLTGTLTTATENRRSLLALRTGHMRANENSTDSYLVTTNDIAGILDIVIAGIRRIHNNGSAAECLSMLLPKESLLKPIPSIKAIIPGSPTIADPATTINSVQPSFCMASRPQYHENSLDSARTTIISRQSITEVT
ncbi:hypothetical protein F5Y04DRAFT_120972 [Hypomontagnella monticulosa]|nr:hypothetical protein F5Y04DRAFT_120972 [Hypomontagnella monticulosa]